ncbi:MAG: hypothetical protein AAFO95_09375 [Cyanobacteria bacterium J06600_6]
MIAALWTYFPVNANISLEKSNYKQNSTLKSEEQGNLVQSAEKLREQASIYSDLNKTKQEIETLLELSRIYIRLGRYNSALEELKVILTLSPSKSALATTQKILGNTYSGLGEYEQAIKHYESSLKKPTIKSQLSTLNNLVQALNNRRENQLALAREVRPEEANQYLTQATSDRILARKYASQALALSQNEISTSAVRALINWNSQWQQQKLKSKYLDRGSEILEKLPPSRSLVYLTINWAKIDRDRRIYWLRKAERVAEVIADDRAKSYVFLEIGYYYQDTQNIEKALSYAKKAQLKAQFSFTGESLYRSQSLAGKLYQQIGSTNAAIKAYQGAIVSIDTIYQSVIGTESRQITIAEFEQEIEPVYRETLKLILNNAQNDSETLNEALLVYDKLRLAQLRSYFGDNCFEVSREDFSNQTV